jgi:hypothetical protein
MQTVAYNRRHSSVSLVLAGRDKIDVSGQDKLATSKAQVYSLLLAINCQTKPEEREVAVARASREKQETRSTVNIGSILGATSCRGNDRSSASDYICLQINQCLFLYTASSVPHAPRTLVIRSALLISPRSLSSVSSHPRSVLRAVHLASLNP